MSEHKRRDWRELCAAVSNERDSNKLGSLVQELIAALDEHERNLSVSVPSYGDEGTVSSGGLCRF
jgi:hypothetical protein